MDIQPAHIEQIVHGEDGKLYEVSAESSQVAADLAAIDPGLKVRFSEQERCYIIRHDRHDDCPHNGNVDSYLVMSVKAERNRSGTFEGLDQRVVDRIRFIDPKGRSGYDFVRQLELNRIAQEEREGREFRERIEPFAELAAYRLRKDLGERYRGRAFITRKPREA